MKVTVTKEFGSPEEAAAWLRVFSPAPAEMSEAPVQGPVQEKKPRKPRADAGKPRGPYKTNGGPAASEPGNTADSVATTPAAPVSPTTAAAPETVQKDGTDKAAASVPAKSEPAAAAPFTEADARAALKRINQTPGLGMEAVMTHLRDFGVNRVTLLKPEQYADFIKQADEKVADAAAAAARDAKVAK